MSEYVPVAKASDVPENEVIVVDVDGHSIALCHVAGDEIYAIDNVCTHDDGPLGEGTLRDDRVECPRHGALFDVRTGTPKTLPAVKPVRAYPTRVVGDEVQIDLEGAG